MDGRKRAVVGAAQAGFTIEGGSAAQQVTVALATWPDDGRDPKTLIAHADEGLYFAKHHGRNQAIAWADIQQPPLRAVK